MKFYDTICKNHIGAALFDLLKPFTSSNRKFSEYLYDFGNSIINPYKKQLFLSEYDFFDRFGLLSKLSSGRWLADIISKCGIGYGMGSQSTISSYLFYRLNISRANPIYHELVFEQIFNHPYSSFSNKNNDKKLNIDFTIGSSQKDRFISILNFTCNAQSTIIPPEKSYNGKESLIVFLTNNKNTLPSDFTITNNNNGKISPDFTKESGISHIFPIILDKTTDVIENTLRFIFDDKGELITPETIPLTDTESYENFFLLYEAEKLGFKDKIPLLDIFNSIKLKNFETLTALFALKMQSPVNYFSEFMDSISNNSWAERKINYEFLGLLEETRGFLLYQEQLIHILHFLGNLPYQEAFETFRLMLSSDYADVSKKAEYFIDGAVSQGLSQHRAILIFHDLFHKSSLLVSKNRALAEIYPLYHLSFLKTNYEKEYQRSFNQAQ